MNQVAASPGAACHSNEIKPSHVLKAMGIPDEIALGTVRFSTGHTFFQKNCLLFTLLI
jgi:cysteine desulfurase